MTKFAMQSWPQAFWETQRDAFIAYFQALAKRHLNVAYVATFQPNQQPALRSGRTSSLHKPTDTHLRKTRTRQLFVKAAKNKKLN